MKAVNFVSMWHGFLGFCLAVGMYWGSALAVVAVLSAQANAAAPASGDSAQQVMATPMVNINLADAEALAEALNGVGIVRAKAIVSYRKEHGDFATIEELANVRGIGLATVDKNAHLITLGEKPDKEQEQ